MNNSLIYAQISEERIMNIAVCENYEFANWLTRATYGDEAFAVQCNGFSVQPGDAYREGIFYHQQDDGTEIQVDRDELIEETVLRLTNTVEYLSMLAKVDLEV